MIVEMLIANGVVTLLISGCVAFIYNILLERHKAELSKELEALKSSHEFKTHITKSQFDTEFNTYKVLWGHLFPARISVLNLRPKLDIVDPQKSKDEIKLERLKNFYSNLTKIRDELEKSKPFIDETVYSKIRQILEVAHSEALDYEHLNVSDVGLREYWKKQDENHKEIENLIDEASIAIKSRLQSVHVVD